MLLIDELCQWHDTPGPREFYTALSTALPKMPGGRLVIMSTAGDPAHFSRKIYDQAVRSPRWRVSEVHGPAPWQDPGELAEQEAALLPSTFQRLFHNIWTSPEDRLTSMDALRACVTLDGPQEPKPGVRYKIGLDVGWVNDATVAAVAHMEGEPGSGTVVSDRMAVWQGRKGAQVDFSAVEGWVRDASRTYNGAPVIFDPCQSVQLTQRLREQGVTCVQFTFSTASVGKLAMALYQLLRDGRLALPDDDELLDELANVRLVERTPGVFRLDHDPGKHDDRAIALALAADALLATVPGRAEMIFDDGPGAAGLAVAGSPILTQLGRFAYNRSDLSIPGTVPPVPHNDHPWSQV